MATRRPKGDGSIYRRADGRWIGRLYYTDPVSGLGRRAQATAVTKAEVSRKLKAMQGRLDRGISARDASATFGSFARRWVAASLGASDRKASTKSLYAGLTRTHIIDSDLGKTQMKALRPSTVERFVSQLRAKGLAPSSVRQIYTVARAIGDAAVADGLLGTNPFAAVRRPRVTTTEATFLEPAQITTLLQHAEASRYAPLFELLVNTGLRRGEALALQWSDIDTSQQLLRVRGTLTRVDGDLAVTAPKSAKSHRSIPLSAPALAVLETVRARTKRTAGRPASCGARPATSSSLTSGSPATPATRCGPSSRPPPRPASLASGSTPCVTPRPR